MSLAELLLKVPSQAWIALATAILASAMTLLGVWLTNKASTQRLKLELEHKTNSEREATETNRIEELFIISNRYLNSLCSYYFPYRLVMYGEITFDQALDITIESSQKNDFDPNKVTMLIQMYFPDIHPHFNEIIEIREKLNDILSGYKAQYKQGHTDGRKWLKEFQPLLEEMAHLCDNFDKHIISLNDKCTTK